MNEDIFANHGFFRQIVDADIRETTAKDISYRASWKKRGGVGAFMMLARKWDRLESMAQERGYDVFVRPGDGSDGTVIAEVRDLRRYLMQLESELMARGEVLPYDPPDTDVQVKVQHTIEPALEALDRYGFDIGDSDSPVKRLVPRVPPEPDYPGTPEDGGQHGAQEPENENVNEDGAVIRRPSLLTNFEYEALGYTTVPEGTMAGAWWRGLYDQTPDGRWLIKDDFRKEYASS